MFLMNDECFGMNEAIKLLDLFFYLLISCIVTPITGTLFNQIYDWGYVTIFGQIFSMGDSQGARAPDEFKNDIFSYPDFWKK